MSIRNHAAPLAIFAIGSVFTPSADAALWSSTNAVGRISEFATMEISFTGDQLTVGAQVDVVLPTGLTDVTVSSMDGGGCGYNASTRTARFTVFDFGLRPLPTWPRPVCTLRYRVSRSTSIWLPMGNALCIDVESEALPSGQCARDAGYLTVTR